MKNIIVLFLMILSPCMAFGNISLTPFFIEFDADAANRSSQVRFTNTTKEEKTYKIQAVNFKQKLDGAYSAIEKAEKDNPFANEYLDFSPRLVTLKPMQSQVVRVQRRGMAIASDGEYVSHLLIREMPKNNNDNNSSNKNGLVVNIETLYGVSIPVMITKGQISATARVKNTKITNDNGAVIAHVTMERFGTRSFYGTLIVKDGDKEIGTIKQFRIFMTTSARTIKIPLSSKPKNIITVTLIDERKNEILEAKSI